MHVVFIGTTRFGLRCLQTLAALRQCRVVGAVAAPPEFPISYRPEGLRNLLHADVPGFCEAAGIPCALITAGMKDATLLERVRGWRPDAFLVAGWYHMVPRPWRELAPAYGLHASLLPDYSGGAPLVWAMINGEKRTGITLFRLADGVDSGPVVGRAETAIGPEDTIATLYERIEELGLQLLEAHMPRLADGSAILEPQDESRRRIFPQRGPEDGRIDWSWATARIHDFVRAQTRPYPGAFTSLGGRRLIVWSTRSSEPARPPLAPGCFATVDDRLLAGTADGTLELLDLERDGESLDPGALGEGCFDPIAGAPQ
jgi:methionyl-tRNA formyltransferase